MCNGNARLDHCARALSRSDDLEGDNRATPKTDRKEFDAQISARDAVEFYLPPFRAAMSGDSAARSIMCAYNAVNGVASCANDALINGVLRGAWGWDGFVVSDCDAIDDEASIAYANATLNNTSLAARAASALRGGTDLNCGEVYGEALGDAVTQGLVEEADVDAALERVLAEQFRLGYFDDPADQPWASLGAESVDTRAHRELALDGAVAAMTLLANRAAPDGIYGSASGGGAFLPLARNALARVAMIGPHANATADLLGGGNYHGDNAVFLDQSPLLGVTRALAAGRGERGDAPVVVYARGTDVTSNDTSGIAAAVDAARGADVAIVCIGLNGDVENESLDRASLALPGAQQALVDAVLASGTPVVLVLINGGALALPRTWVPPAATAADGDDGNDATLPAAAILEAWYPGQAAGDALAAVLFGDRAPAGRLPITFYDAALVDARNITDMNLRDRGGVTYRYYEGEPLFAFGHGLSYSTFEFAWSANGADHANATTREIAADADVDGSVVAWDVTVTNVGGATSACVALAFARSDHAVAPRGGKLVGFARTAALAPGESAAVRVPLSKFAISLTDEAGVEAVRAGEYAIEIGDVAAGNVARGRLSLTGDDEVLFSLPSALKRDK